ncbi:hypothetical protein Tco_0760765 [Tanacetum coccineum]
MPSPKQDPTCPNLSLASAAICKNRGVTEWARMEHDMAERRLHVSQGWNKRFYMEMVRIRAVPKPPYDDEDTKRLNKKSKNSTFDGTEGPSELRGPPSDS